ncbi:hypothetical protein MOQ72_34435 [Saccharopolyspora sp. K220]|uniref:hypothetical protein n=1 Tax=Saccharopolyspora soli TaxID=2926618 RepID=UPI001F5AC6CF|nr:hypothetical protein [Saccharopolyspora soli]MCI2422538.1 hypothetical protein [Saccharopolyspora soli]
MSSDGCPTLDNLDEASIGFLFDAVDLGMEYAKLEANGFVPLATVLGEDGSKNIWKLFENNQNDWTVEGGVALGRQKLQEVDDATHCVTLIYDGYFTGDGERTEAVFVEAYELGRPAGVLMAQRYERRGGGLNLIGNPMLLEDEQEPLVPPDRPAAEFPNLGPEATKFTRDAIELGLQQVETGQSIFMPFATVLAADGSRDLWRFVDDEADPTVGGALDLAHQRLQSVDQTSRCVALVWGGDLPDEDGEGAVFVEGYELGCPIGVVMVQPYQRLFGDDDDDHRVIRMGDPFVLEEREPLVPPRPTGRAAAIARIQELADRQRHR